MKVTIPRQDLLDAVNKVKAVVSPKSALPILSHALLETKDGVLKLTATDLKVSIECTVDCRIDEPGSMTVSSARLASILSELPDTDLELALGDNNVITLTCGKIQTKLFSMSPDEFPPVRDFQGIEPMVLDQGILKKIFSRTSFAISTDQARYNLTGLLCDLSDGKFTAVATDGRRMSLYIQDEGIPESAKATVIIPGKMIHELERLLGNEGEVRVFVDETQAAFEFGTVRIVTALIEGSFPPYDKVVPKKHDKEIVLDTALFTEAVRRTRTMTNDKFNSVRFQLGDGVMQLRVVTPEVGEYEEEMPIDYGGDQFEIAFNPDFMVDVLRHTDSEKVSFVLKDATSPGLLKPSGNGDSDRYLNVIMPIRI
jgi:DNA polymerase III subunit beta